MSMNVTKCFLSSATIFLVLVFTSGIEKSCLAETDGDTRSLRPAAVWNYSQSQFTAKVSEWKAKGYRPESVEVYRDNGHTRFAAIFIKDGRGWGAYWRATYSQFNDACKKYREKGYRMTDIEIINENGHLRYTAIWVENVERLGWSARWNMRQSGESDDYGEKQRKKGYRPIDIEFYRNGDHVSCAQIWIENREKWNWYAQITNDHIGFKEDQKKATEKGMQPIDIESMYWNGERYYCGIWVGGNGKRKNKGWKSIRNYSQSYFESRHAEYRKNNYRLIHLTVYPITNGTHFAAIWQKN